MPTGGAVKLTIDSDKVGYVRLPNGGILTTVAGVIDEIYNGAEGNIVYYVPKNTSIVDVSNSDLAGNIVYDGSADLDCNSTSVTSLTANRSSSINCSTTPITILEANNALNVIASSCPLTPKSIGDFLIASRINNFQLLEVLDLSSSVSQAVVEEYYTSINFDYFGSNDFSEWISTDFPSSVITFDV